MRPRETFGVREACFRFGGLGKAEASLAHSKRFAMVDCKWLYGCLHRIHGMVPLPESTQFGGESSGATHVIGLLFEHGVFAMKMSGILVTFRHSQNLSFSEKISDEANARGR